MKKIAIILAGGQATRMGGADKARLKYQGARLIDHVLNRLHPQIDEVAISGQSNYETGLPFFADLTNGPKGPAAGLFAAANWMRINHPDCAGFLSVPVDGPNLPLDLFERLATTTAAIAADESGAHPTFAHWSLPALRDAFLKIDLSSSISLYHLAEMVAARVVKWPGDNTFKNINTPEDLADVQLS